MHTHNSDNLLDLAETLRLQTDFDETLRLVTNQSAFLLGGDYAVVVLINPQTRETIKTAYAATEAEKKDQFSKIRHNLIAGWMFQKHQHLLANEIHKDKRFDSVDFREHEFSILGSLLEVEDSLLGALLVVRKARTLPFTKGDLDYLKKLSGIAVPYLKNVHQVTKIFHAQVTEQTLLEKYKVVGLIGTSKPFLELLHAVEAATRSDVRILLEGQSGTGKELVARAIHTFGTRQNGPFVPIDCGAIAENLMESELFGHVRGAFTGAHVSRKGLFEAANNGTLFLDEIANLSLPTQAKLMRVLQEGEVRPVGSNEIRKIDVRIIVASSASLQELVQTGEFREDLFYRLHIYPIQIPSLNERRKDIGLLVYHFIKKGGRSGLNFSSQIIDFLKEKAWPGNIRELQNLVERMLAFAPPESNPITPTMLPTNLKAIFDEWRKNRSLADQPNFNQQMFEFEKKLIVDTLDACDWNQSQAARLLHMSERNIRHKMKKLGIRRS